MEEKITLSLAEKIQFFFIIGTAPFTVALTALQHLIFRPADSPGTARAVATSLLKIFSRLSYRQIHGMIKLPSTGKVIEDFCLKNNVEHDLITLWNDARVHWIGPHSQDGKVLLYFHGGGYINSATAEHVTFARECAAKARASLAMLEYTLAPEARFPTQLIQASNALRYILTTTSPSKVYIAGESAGAHLAISLLSHVIHNSDGIDMIPLLEDIGGICLISPFVSFDFHKESYTFNAKTDYLSQSQLKEMFSTLFKPLNVSEEGALRDPRLSPLDAPANWWKNCPVQKILITGGLHEVLLQDIHEFAKRLEEEAGGRSEVLFVSGRREVHAACIQDTFLKKQDGDTWLAIMKWMEDTK